MATMTQSHSVGSVSKLTGVTVRTLHHYDQIGLLVPSDRSQAGYRLYHEADLDRLRQILFYRELGFSLDQIAELLQADADRTAHLRQQRLMVADRIERLQAVAAAIETELEAQQMGIQLTQQEKFELFGDGYRDDYAAEAEQRWGRSDAFAQSQRRSATYTKEQWQQIKAAAAANEQRFAGLLAAGVPAGAEAAMEAAEEHRQHIATWFYDIPVAMHRGLAEMYLADARFTAYYDTIAPGLAGYISAAITNNADRQAG